MKQLKQAILAQKAGTNEAWSHQIETLNKHAKASVGVRNGNREASGEANEAEISPFAGESENKLQGQNWKYC